MDTENVVWIIWTGEEEDAFEMERYEFATMQELDAFLKGVDRGSCWLDCDVFDTADEATEAARKRRLAGQRQLLH